MAEEKKSKTLRSALRTEEFGRFQSGDKVEFDGRLAKVVTFGIQELTAAPGEDRTFSDGPVLTLQLPAQTPGGRAEYAYRVDPSEVKPLRDDPEKQRKLETEWNALFGDPVPVEPSKEKAEAPKIRQSGAAPEAKRTSSTRGKEGKGAEGKTTAAASTAPRDTSGGVKVDTSKPAEAPKAAKKAAPKAEKKATPKSVKKAKK